MTPRFDGTAHWRQLSPEAMEEIGSAALELAAAYHVQCRANEDGHLWPAGVADRLLRGAQASKQLQVDVLRGAFADHIDQDAVECDGIPLLPSALGPTCRACGCSQLDACQPFSCCWVEPDLCSACAPTGAE